VLESSSSSSEEEASEASQSLMMPSAASMPAVMLVVPCAGSATAHMAAAVQKSLPITFASWLKTVSEQGPFASPTSSEKHFLACSVVWRMLPLLSSTKWNRVGGRVTTAGCSLLKPRPTTQVLPSPRAMQRARACSGRAFWRP